MILKFDVSKFVPFVPFDHKDINDHRLYVYDNRNSDVFDVWSSGLRFDPDKKITLYVVLSDGTIQNTIEHNFKTSEVMPAWTSIKKVGEETLNIIFE